MKKSGLIGLSIFIMLGLVYELGPIERYEYVDNMPIYLDIAIKDIDRYVKSIESEFKNIKVDNEARIIWADSTVKTDYAFVYLHGFSASHGEGFPIIQNISKRYNANIFLSRLSRHGLKNDDAMLTLTPESWIKSAKEAVAIGKQLGEKVILVSTSTGSTLSVYLAANDPDIHSMVMMSPNFDLYDKKSKLITMPWGKNILKIIKNGNYHYWDINNEAVQKYWNTKKRVEALIALRNLIDQTMTSEIFSQISIPYLIGYYYKNEEEKDEVISIEAIHRFHNLTDTPSGQKKLIDYGDAGTHVIGCQYLNPNWLQVQKDIFEFLDSIM